MKARLLVLGWTFATVVLLLSQRANAAGYMQIETLPPQTDWIADGITEYEVQVRIDSNETRVANALIASAAWHFTIPSPLIGHLTLTRSSLPDPTNNPSIEATDFFAGIRMDNQQNRVGATVTGGEIADNVRAVGYLDHIYRDFEHGWLGSYWFTVDRDAPQDQYAFGLNSVLFVNWGGYDYMSNDLNAAANSCIITNGRFNVTPEPATLSLLAVGGLALLHRRRGASS